MPYDFLLFDNLLFNSLDFGKFLIPVLVVSWLLIRWTSLRLFFLLCASYYFYASWNLSYVPLIFVASTIDWALGIALGNAKTDRMRKLILLGTIVSNTALLAYFKYWNFGVEIVQDVAGLLGLAPPELMNDVEYPLGLSFFTFMSLSYVIDVYRRHLEPCRNYLHYLTYIAIFPHLIAGPIIRGRDLLPLLSKRPKLTADEAGEALFLIAGGLFKKVVIGDYLAVNLIRRVFDEPSSYSSLEVLAAMYAYAVQVYCDFSGYSDIAIGMALLLGYRFKINFDAPFKSTNIVEFWRRWHISLSSWLRDYIYIPLGGGRSGRARKYFNVWITMVICGLWHRATWNMVFFGAIQGFALVATHLVQDARRAKKGESAKKGEPEGEENPLALGRVVSVLCTFTFVAVSFALFRADSGWKAGLAVLIQWTPRKIFVQARDRFIRAPAIAQAAVLFLVGLALRQAATADVVEFEYFQF